MVSPSSGKTLTKFEVIINNTDLSLIWIKAIFKELCILAQGYSETQGINTEKIMSLDEIHHIPEDHTRIYVRTVSDFRPKKTTQTGSESLFVEVKLIIPGI